MVNESEEKKTLNEQEQREVTVDDIVPVLQELESRIELLEQLYQRVREHEHGIDGKPVNKM